MKIKRLFRKTKEGINRMNNFILTTMLFFLGIGPSSLIWKVTGKFRNEETGYLKPERPDTDMEKMW